MPLVCVLRVLLFRAFSQAFFYQNSSSYWFCCSLQPFVGLCSSQSGFCRAPFQFDWFILGLFLWPSSAQVLLLFSGFALFSISQGSFHSECFLLGIFHTLLLPTSQLFFLWFWSFQCFLGLLSSQCAVWGVFHMCHRLWQGDCTCKQVVNRLKIAQGLSTLLFHRWSEVPSRGGVCSDSLYEKLPALQSQSCHLSVFCECCFLELLARPSSIRTILLSCSLQPFVGPCSSQSCFHRAPFQFYWFILGLFLLWPSTIQLLWLVFLFCSAFHQAPLILNAWGGGGGGGQSYPCLYPALLVVLFLLAFLSVSLSSQCAFRGQCTCHSLWLCDFTHNRKQVVNRLKIPQGLSTLLFHRWSEVPSRGGVRGDSPYEKLPALQRCHLSVFSECCFLELLARPSSITSIRTLLSGFVVLLSILLDSVLLRVVFIGLLSDLTGSFQELFFGLLQPSYCCYLVISLRLTFHRAPFILIACLWVFFIHFFCPHPSSSSCDFGLLVFLMTPLFLVCCLGCIPHVSRTVAGRLHL